MSKSIVVDCRGMACPKPVLKTKEALEESGSAVLKVLVDNSISRDNVSRFARSQGCEVDVREQGEEFHLSIRREGAGPVPETKEEPIICSAPDKGIVVYIATDSMGVGSDDLGRKLIRGFLRTWIDIDPKPWRMIFINDGVKLTTTDKEAVEALGLLEERGVEILSCGTCLEYFKLVEHLKVGKPTNMYEVIESLSSASKVISPD
jgi:selenium metabolism protein YedF